MKIDIKRAWTDAEYRASLSPEEIRGLPANPAGDGELTDVDLDAVAGGLLRHTTHIATIGCPQP